MNKCQKAMNRYTKESVKYMETRYGSTENFRIMRVWNRQDLKDIYGNRVSINTLNRLNALIKRI